MDYIEYLQDYWIWLVLLGLFVLSYLTMPCFIKSTQRFRQHFSLDEFDPVEIPLPNEAAAFFQQTFEQLEPIGFQLVHHFLVPDLFPNVTAVFVLFENRAQNDVALAVVAYGFPDESRKVVLLQKMYIEFGTEFEDGNEISTKNSRQESIFKPVARRHVFEFPDTKDISTLYLAHQRLVERFGKPPKRPLPAPGQWENVLRHDMTGEFEEQLETGYLQMDATREFFIMTWKGAYLMTWKLMWPISLIRLTCRRIKARKLLAEFSLEQRR